MNFDEDLEVGLDEGLDFVSGEDAGVVEDAVVRKSERGILRPLPLGGNLRCEMRVSSNSSSSCIFFDNGVFELEHPMSDVTLDSAETSKSKSGGNGGMSAESIKSS